MLIQNSLGFNVQPTALMRYTNIGAESGEQFVFANSVDGEGQLEKDTNDDGNGDIEVAPSFTVSGTLLTDTKPPTVTISYNVDTQMATINATDEGVGIATISYSTDGVNYYLYETPVTIPQTGMTLYAQAEDILGNLSDVVSTRLSGSSPLQRGYLPVVTR